MRANFKFCFTILILTFACSSNLEVRKDEAVVIYDQESGDVSDTVFKEGVHNVNSDVGVAYYDLIPSPEKVDFSFNFLTNDASEWKIEFSLKYSPKVDSLPSFFRKYRTQNIAIAVETEIKALVRNYWVELPNEQVKNDVVFAAIKDQLDSGIELQNFLEISEFVPGKLDFIR